MCPLINSLEEHHFCNINESNSDGGIFYKMTASIVQKCVNHEKQGKTEELKSSKR